MKKFLSFFLVLFMATNLFAQTPNVTTTIENVTATEVTAAFEMNAACNGYRVYISTDDDMFFWTGMMQCTEEVIVLNLGAPYSSDTTHTFNDLVPGTEYGLYVLAFGTSDTVMLRTTVTTNTVGGTGTSSISIAVTNITSTSALVTCTPNEETARFNDFIIEQSSFAEIGADSVIAILKEDPNIHYVEYEWEWLTLNPGTAYYAVAIGQNADGVWGDMTKVPFSTTPTAVVNHKNGDFNIYPNPAKTSVKLEDIPSHGYLQVCDLQGKIIFEKTLDDSNTTIDLSNVAKGVYMVKISDGDNHQFMVKKLVVR